jgi:hypothetical protein
MAYTVELNRQFKGELTGHFMQFNIVNFGHSGATSVCPLFVQTGEVKKKIQETG